MERIATWVSYIWSSIMSLLGLLSLNEYAVLVGIATGLGTYFTNRYYRKKDEERKIERQEWDRKMFQIDYELKKQQRNRGINE
ncbi:HP1 family phage holin [Serratia sp. MF2]|uniref:HP1 family phage holin n=1 Tax=Serratia sp. MF1(2023) TaxID=3059171 RepID=UPI0027E7155E|nr:HP1 family phage holin [Serratia sp. MF1(2023)]MDQ7104221.1 HP1 family phage holin [Serratia sp. MF1(2023)]